MKNCPKSTRFKRSRGTYALGMWMRETEKAEAETAKTRVERDDDAMDVDGVMVVKAEEWQEYVSRCRKTGVGKTPGFAGQGR